MAINKDNWQFGFTVIAMPTGCGRKLSAFNHAESIQNGSNRVLIIALSSLISYDWADIVQKTTNKEPVVLRSLAGKPVEDVCKRLSSIPYAILSWESLIQLVKIGDNGLFSRICSLYDTVIVDCDLRDIGPNHRQVMDKLYRTATNDKNILKYFVFVTDTFRVRKIFSDFFPNKVDM